MQASSGEHSDSQSGKLIVLWRQPEEKQSIEKARGNLG